METDQKVSSYSFFIPITHVEVDSDTPARTNTPYHIPAVRLRRVADATRI